MKKVDKGSRRNSVVTAADKEESKGLLCVSPVEAAKTVPEEPTSQQSLADQVRHVHKPRVHSPTHRTFAHTTTQTQVGELQFKIEKLNVPTSEWTLEEDCFLVRHFGIRKTPAKQIEGKYYQLKAKSPGNTISFSFLSPPPPHSFTTDIFIPPYPYFKEIREAQDILRLTRRI